MTSSNAWAEFAAMFARTRSAHEHAKAELKGLMPAEAQQAFGHGGAPNGDCNRERYREIGEISDFHRNPSF